MNLRAVATVAVAIFAAALGTVQAQSLRVSPVSIELMARSGGEPVQNVKRSFFGAGKPRSPEKGPAVETSSVRVWNDSSAPMTVQVEIFRWVQSEGKENSRIKTTDMVVSPPRMILKPGGDNVVRVLRVSKAPVNEEESYRLMITELPAPKSIRGSGVSFSVEHSIPVFVTPQNAPLQSPVSFSIAPRKGGFTVRARNDGITRTRIVNLIAANGPRQIAAQTGLVGYALGGSVMEWFVEARTEALGRGPVTITYEGDQGPVTVQAQVEAR